MVVPLIVILLILVLVLLALVIVQAKGSAAAREQIVRQSTSIDLFQRQLEAIRESQSKQTDTLSTSLQTGQLSLTQQLQKSYDTLSRLHTQLGQLQSDSARMIQLGTDVRSLQEILKSPKLRGQIGEHSLERLLGEILPAGSFDIQHHFSNGTVVDALVRMPDYSVSIDAKFPLPAFEKMLKAESDEERARLRRVFQSDVTKHVDKIASDYINPTEGTLDFALMYIPAENVYYETVIKYGEDKTDILKYALDKKVIPISPNLLYAYLMTIVMGLHGLQIEKQAANIRQNLKKISAGLEAFASNFDVLGKHLRNAQSQYDEANTKLNRFTTQLEQIQAGQQEADSEHTP